MSTGHGTLPGAVAVDPSLLRVFFSFGRAQPRRRRQSRSSRLDPSRCTLRRVADAAPGVLVSRSGTTARSAWCWTSAGGRALTRGRALSDDGSICRRCASTTRGSVKQKKKGPSMSSLTLHHRWSQEEVAEGTRQMSLHLLSTCTCPVLMACSRRADRCLAQFYLFLILFLSYTITEAAYLSSPTLLRVREND